MELLRLENAVIGYSTDLAPPFSLTISPGERVALIGPNGGGKSTLLKSLLGLIPLRAGVRWAATPPPRLGYVPQAHRADPVFPLTALEVTLQGRFGHIGVGRLIRQADRDEALSALAAVGMADDAHRHFRQLSGGQRQRVLLARALSGRPQLLALDEFTSELDPAGSARLLDEVSRLADGGTALVFVTHEISAAARHARRLVMLDTHHRLVEIGPTESLLSSERLSALYGQPMSVERRDDRIVVFAGEAR